MAAVYFISQKNFFFDIKNPLATDTTAPNRLLYRLDLFFGMVLPTVMSTNTVSVTMVDSGATTVNETVRKQQWKSWQVAATAINQSLTSLPLLSLFPSLSPHISLLQCLCDCGDHSNDRYLSLSYPLGQQQMWW